MPSSAARCTGSRALPPRSWPRRARGPGQDRTRSQSLPSPCTPLTGRPGGGATPRLSVGGSQRSSHATPPLLPSRALRAPSTLLEPNRASNERPRPQQNRSRTSRGRPGRESHSTIDPVSKPPRHASRDRHPGAAPWAARDDARAESPRSAQATELSAGPPASAGPSRAWQPSAFPNRTWCA